MKIKQLIVILLIGFVLFWLFTDPSGLAVSAQFLFFEGWDLVVGLFNALLDFLAAL